MSESSHSATSGAFVHQLLDLDNEMKAKICEKGKSAAEIYQTYFDILSLYEKTSILPLNESDKLLLQDKKEDLYLQFKLFKFKQGIKEQVDNILIQLDDLQKNM